MPQNPFVGEIFASGFNFAPVGYAACNGALLPISQYTALFALLGTQFGGNGTSTFALPDLRSRVGVGAGQGNGLSPYDIGNTGGSEAVTLNVGQMPLHTHPVAGSLTNGNSTVPTDSLWAKSSQADKIYSNSGQSTTMSGSAIGPAGGSQPHENRPPFLALNYYIALIGIFPARN